MATKRQLQRRDTAAERTVAAEGRTSVEQLARLDARLGKGQGAVKERRILNTRTRPFKSK